MVIVVPDKVLVALVGAAGSGKSTFAENYFLSTEIVSSDGCRAMVCDNPDNQEVSKDAFELLYHIIHKRLKNRRTTVIDATNVARRIRRHILGIAGRYGVENVIAVVFDVPRNVCVERNRKRTRRVETDVISRQIRRLHATLDGITGEGFSQVYILYSTENVVIRHMEESEETR
ncbi:MAG: AAA family ATPase [Chitinivibrionales bacterium]|nr:AAA family ATPase [Chitinivibrionales bacterium]